jgi:DNA-directed RNA polymerase subunit RPC12/RpoP
VRTTRCPSCDKAFDLLADQQARYTVLCPHCGRVVLIGAVTAPVGSSDDPSTEAFLEPLHPAEDPTQIGVASKMLSLPLGKRVSVAILSGPRKGDVVVLDRPRLSFGRDGAGADVQVPDLDVSRDHAAVECHGARIMLRDLESRNGTFVGDQRVSQREIKNDDEFRLGRTTFMLLVVDE